MTFPETADILNKVQTKLTRVERTEYGAWLPTAIRKRVEVRKGAAIPERLRERPAEENLWYVAR